ncbi:V-type proton ATPase subunit F isoform X1 [Gadus chalcogrammus]|uniref:V-type proton ATPase subunit F isoform X1 n=1 Tax=Gadus chalcogrammus TaxID=1042646 RepID=UPI0024C2DBF8|nr:V-type proton ATPase subunit F isoform X1 [Gadus chalcogrammus]
MFSRSLLVKPSSSMTPSWSVVVMWLLVCFVSGGPLTSLDVNNGTSFDPHDGNSTERNGNYTKSPKDPAPTSFDPDDGNITERVFLSTPGMRWPTHGVHSIPPSGDEIAGYATMDPHGNGKK